MRKSNFLSKLKAEGKLKLVEESEEMMLSYLKKSSDSLKAAKLLLNAGLEENSVSSSYYAMYNSLIALLFKCGIKCENHTRAIMLLKEFGLFELEKIIRKAKKERIDKQYYADTENNLKLNATIAKELVSEAEEFIFSLRAYLTKLKSSDISMLREKFREL
ncbi:MAG: HEPN domain-containing protein [Nanoarchaeota archaeon]|nr:HEPN domain-containing protein [Nanoarchaeota archaeon]MBU1622266.1 HEPN domain-containing protein [Nanoarchaeota archaeon]